MLKRNAFLGMAAMVLISTLLLPGQSHAICGASEESGIWINPDPDLKALTRIEIQTTCDSGQRGWKVRALTQCARTECTWGYSQGVRRPDGALAALFSTFTAERLIRMLVDRDSMRIIVVNAFRGGRENSVDRYLFQRQY